MPWRESSVVEQRLRFVVAASGREQGFSSLCREFGISRQTGYTWLKRYAAGGSSQVVDRSRRPLHSPARTAAEVEQEVIQLRQRWPDWGAPKLYALLQRQHGGNSPIAVRTVHRILERHDLIHDQDRNVPALKRFERSQPNELWQMDFKGLHGSAKTSPVGPLSILDDHSRYVLALEQLGSTAMSGVRATLEITFQHCGVPDAMWMDHGTPWWNAASPWGLTEVAVWIMRQGVRLMFSGIRHPQTQGKVERMHGALQQAARKRRADLVEQTWLDLFRHEYNHVRPHESLAWRPRPAAGVPALACFQARPRTGTIRPACRWCGWRAKVNSAGADDVGRSAELYGASASAWNCWATGPLCTSAAPPSGSWIEPREPPIPSPSTFTVNQC